MINSNPSILVTENSIQRITRRGLQKFKSLKEFKKQIGERQINLVLTGELSFLNTLKNGSQSSFGTRFQVQKVLQNEIPEDLSQSIWGYKNIGSKSNVLLQTLVIEHEKTKDLFDTFTKNKIKIANYSSLPFLITQTLPPSLGPQILIFAQKDILFLALTDQKSVYLTQNLESLDNLKTNLQQLIQISKEKFNLEVKELISISDQDLSSIKLKIRKIDWKIEKLRFISLISAQSLPQIQEKKATKNKNGISIPDLPNPKPQNKRQTILLVLLLILILTAGPFLIWKLLLDKDDTSDSQLLIDQETINTIEEIPSPSPISTASPSPSLSPQAEFAPQEYVIEVLNGSGIPGEAAVVKDLLIEADYNKVNIEVGNADNQEYQATEIITSDEELYLDLISSLENDYQISASPSATTATSGDIEFDATIILGELKK